MQINASKDRWFRYLVWLYHVNHYFLYLLGWSKICFFEFMNSSMMACHGFGREDMKFEVDFFLLSNNLVYRCRLTLNFREP